MKCITVGTTHNNYYTLKSCTTKRKKIRNESGKPDNTDHTGTAPQSDNPNHTQMYHRRLRNKAILTFKRRLVKNWEKERFFSGCILNDVSQGLRADKR